MLQPLHRLTTVVGMEFGHPNFLVRKYCQHSWKSHAALSCSDQLSSEMAKGFPLPSVAKIHYLLFSAAVPSVFAALHLWPAEDASRHAMALPPRWLYPVTSAVGDRQIFARMGDLGESLYLWCEGQAKP